MDYWTFDTHTTTTAANVTTTPRRLTFDHIKPDPPGPLNRLQFWLFDTRLSRLGNLISFVRYWLWRFIR